jgi:hypothetical protein
MKRRRSRITSQGSATDFQGSQVKGGNWVIAEHGPLAERLFEKLELANEIPA